MTIAATLFDVPTSDRRSAERRVITQDSTIRDLSVGEPHTVLVHDLSCEGLQLETTLDLPVGAEISIGLPGVGTRTVRVIRSDGNLYGCQFIETISPRLLSQAFSASPIVAGPFARISSHSFPEPPVRKWHPAIRIGLLLALGATAWAIILHLAA